MNQKSPYVEFAEANQALITCYDKIKADDFTKMSESTQSSLCSAPKERIKEILRSNQLIMSQIIRERVDVMQHWSVLHKEKRVKAQQEKAE